MYDISLWSQIRNAKHNLTVPRHVKVLCLLFSLYLVWHFKKPSLMTVHSINCVAQIWHVDVIWEIMKAITSHNNCHAYEPCRIKLWISWLPLAGTLWSNIKSLALIPDSQHIHGLTAKALFLQGPEMPSILKYAAKEYWFKGGTEFMIKADLHYGWVFLSRVSTHGKLPFGKCRSFLFLMKALYFWVTIR